MKIINIYFLFLILFSCSRNNTSIINNQSIVFISGKTNEVTKSEVKTWLTKDIEKDTIPGISLLRAAEEILNDKKGNNVIVALIDMPVAINHEALKKNIWNNLSEVQNNNIDDDENGYVDDVNGWNFLGNSNNENIAFMQYEFTRLLRKEKNSSNLKLDTTSQFKRAKLAYDEKLVYAKTNYSRVKKMDSFYFGIKDTLSKFFPNNEISYPKLDSLLQKNKKLEDVIELYKMYKEEDITDSYVNNKMLMAKERINILLNLNYNDREIIGDNVDDIDDKYYGNNNVSHNLGLLDHGTQMAGIIVSTFDQKILQETMSHIKIMPLAISGYGDENDKDIALAIRYAADNGADIINISSGKYFSMHENWVHDAIKYAEAKNVLIIASSGNEGYNLDSDSVFRYPNDISSLKNTEISNNFIRVAGSNYSLDSTFVHSATNYGKTEVDIFAPGEEIYTSSSVKNEKYTYNSGTSAAAAVVSKSAAILKSYYPHLNASDLKKIIMTTGVEYDLNVKMYDSLNRETNIPFKDLSKTGKVLNIYNALVLAELLSKNNSN